MCNNSSDLRPLRIGIFISFYYTALQQGSPSYIIHAIYSRQDRGIQLPQTLFIATWNRFSVAADIKPNRYKISDMRRYSMRYSEWYVNVSLTGFSYFYYIYIFFIDWCVDMYLYCNYYLQMQNIYFSKSFT